MTTHDRLPAHLERIGWQLAVVAEDLYGSSSRGSMPHCLMV